MGRSRLFPITLLILLSAASLRAADAPPYEEVLRSTVRIITGPKSSTGFFVDVPRKEGEKPRRLLVTAAHAFENTKDEKCQVVLRVRSEKDGKEIVRRVVDLQLRNGDKPLWMRHPQMDVAVIPMDLPADADIKPFSLSQIAEPSLAESRRVRVGHDVCIPCFPAQLEANPAGWPILRRGSIASHPLTPLANAKTIFVDYSHFGGDSGSPVVAMLDDKPVVLAVVIAMQRQVDRTSMPFEERTTYTPMNLAVAVQAPFVRELVEKWAKERDAVRATE